MSVRPKRVSHPVVRYEGLESLNNVWSTADKRALLNALQKHGHMDIKKLSEALPHKSPKAIKNMIVSTMTAARRSTKTGQTPPIDMWLEQASSDETNALIPQALLFISLFERHPPPELCDGCDLRWVEAGGDRCSAPTIEARLFQVCLRLHLPHDARTSGRGSGSPN